MQLIEINDARRINAFLTQFHPSNFLQSFDWGFFQSRAGRKVFRYAVVDDKNEIISLIQFFKYRLPLGFSYFYCPKGPVYIKGITSEQKKSIYNFFLEKISSLKNKERAIFFRIEPKEPLQERLVVEKIFSELNYKFTKAKISQPADTLILDLKKDETMLWNALHPKHRYNIKLAEKKGVKIIVSKRKNDLEYFFDLLRKTCERQHIKCHEENYYGKMMDLHETVDTRLMLAVYENKVIAANIMLYFGKTATYLHGASDYEYRHLMAPHLLQWECIKTAKEKNYELYDFFGIAPSYAQETHPWFGITRFKRGFGGEETNDIGCYELVLNEFIYKYYRLAKKLLKKKK